MSETKKSTYWNIDRIMSLILWIAGATLLVLLIRYLSDVLLPFFVACFIAYLLQPLVRFNQRWTHTRGRTLASLLSLLEVTAAIMLLVIIFLPSVTRETDMLGTILKNVTEGRQPLPESVKPVVAFVDKYVNPHEIKAFLDSLHVDSLLNKGTSLLQESIEVIMQVLAWLLTIIYVIFILIDYPQIVNGFKLIFPHKYRDRALTVVREVQTNMDHYFRGQGLVALCATVFYCVGFSIVGLPLAIPMGVLVGILYMIPYFQYVTLIPVAAICLIYSLGGSVEFLPLLGKCGLVYVFSQCICDYIITPHILGKEMGMNPAVILLSLSVWGSLLGIIGMIIALPTSALIMTYYERYISEPASARKSATEGPDNRPKAS